ncbi:AAA ATPase [Kickxella alabastrina]|uniref:AAA ATPase n=1 Tax=Kickxella alabastrina TaxID=61397 RepID=A0ACC1IWC6_9FUNG|nr:AAA ATPase [Kickxella alabastrina]
MPATRLAHGSTRREALAEAPISRPQNNADSPLKLLTNIKPALPAAKDNNSGNNDAPKKTVSHFIATKTVFHRSTAAPQIIGRASEQQAIQGFLQSTVEKGGGGSMYISGNPGTGKTACLQTLIKKSTSTFTSVLVNCVPLTRPGQVYKAVLDAMETGDVSEAGAQGSLERRVYSGNAFLVILDEVDSLLGNRQEVLYRLFEMAAHPDSKMALVGIANALDLTDRFLPRLQARNCEPLLLNFNPYQVTDIVAILQSRLESVAGAGDPVIQRAALELCARKVAATSGDLRKALDVCRQAMEAAESDHKRKAVDKENEGVSLQPKVTIAHIAKTLAKLNGSPVGQKLDALNFQQKLVLCAHISLANIAAAASKKKAAGAGGIAVAGLYAEYMGICGRLGLLAPVSRTEFLDLVSMMETQGIIILEASSKVARRGGRRIVSDSGAADDRAVRLSIDEADIRRALTKTAALSPLL